MDNIIKTVEKHKIDSMKNECPIVFAGETSAGKSSIINLILGEKILPTGITECTSQVCRIKHSEQFMISTKDSKGKEIGENLSFKDSRQMAKKLKVLATKKVEEFTYVDIHMPVPLLQGNVMIVDTPGFGDEKEEKENDVEEKMRSYLPNALAFVFVVNVSNAGGLQTDRLLRVLSDVRNSIGKMVSFSPKDVIFLLNKWDSIAHEDNEIQEAFLEKTKLNLRKSWKEVDDSCIFMISAQKALENTEYTIVFNMFQKVLKEVIERNENKRTRVHLRFLNHFLDECNGVLSSKLISANLSDIENQKKICDLYMKLEKIEVTMKEVLSNIDIRVDAFLDNAASQLYQYVHGSEFKAEVLKDAQKWSRFTIRQKLIARIENDTLAWQKKHINNIFWKEILEDLVKNFENIHRTLHSIKEDLKGFKTPFDVNNRIPIVLTSYVLSTGIVVLGCFMINRFVENSQLTNDVIAAGTLTAWILDGAMEYLEVADDFKTVCEKEFQARINVLTKIELRSFLKKNHFDEIKKIIKSFFDEELPKEVGMLKTYIVTMKERHSVFKSEKGILSSLQSAVILNIQRLQSLKTATNN